MVESFFNPKSVALIGASHEPKKIGYVILENLVKDFKGKIYPINPKANDILNLKVFPSIKNVEDKIDVAIIATPANTVPSLLKECGEKGVKNIIIISGGFSEASEEGKKIEEECKKIIKEKKIRVIGPNCLGILDNFSKLNTLFLPSNILERPKEGNVSFISQSGSIASTIIDCFSEEGIGLARFVSYGNAIDVNECDLLDFFFNDEKTKVILFFLEGVRNGKRFIKIARKVSKKKPIIALKGGKTYSGIKAALSHTASLAGEYKIYSSIFKQVGIIEAENLEEMLDFAKAFSKQPLPRGKNVVIISAGGGLGVITSDECEKYELYLPEVDENIKSKLKEILPSYAIIKNPIDLTGNVTSETYLITLEECLKSNLFDGAILILLFQSPLTDNQQLLEELPIIIEKYKKPVLCCSPGGKSSKHFRKILEEKNIPTYDTPERAVRSFAAMVRYVNLNKLKPQKDKSHHPV
ncbi:MAG: CoA-binding protein [Candidatus Aenigmatarchaeota archaeon]